MRGFGLIVQSLGDGAVRVGLRGELDLERAYSFDEELRRVEADRPACLVLDLRELTFVDSSGVARLLAAQRRARREGRRVVVVRGPAAVQRLFAISALDEVFEFVSDVPAALSHH
jgi:anti-anti-sigma factor